MFSFSIGYSGGLKERVAVESKLVERVIELLHNRNYKVTIRQISEKTSIPEGWIKQLQRGKINEPSCPRIEKLYEYLTGTEINVE